MLFGTAVEAQLQSTPAYLGSYFLPGAAACLISWRMFRSELLHQMTTPESSDEEVANIKFIADSTPSRGASACTYGMAGLAAVLCGERVVPAGVAVRVCYAGARLFVEVFARKQRQLSPKLGLGQLSLQTPHVNRF